MLKELDEYLDYRYGKVGLEMADRGLIYVRPVPYGRVMWR